MSLDAKSRRSSRKVRLLLVNPPLPHNRRLKRIFPMGLLYLASYVRQNNPNAEVEIFNPQVTNTGFRRTLSEVLSRRWDVLGLGYWTCQSQFAARLSTEVKAAGQGGLIVHGGVHPTLKPGAVARYADWVVLHEGEKTLAHILEQYAEGGAVTVVGDSPGLTGSPRETEPDSPCLPAGTVRLKDGELIATPFGGFIKDLDDLPFPAWDLLDVKLYDTPLHVLGSPRFPIIGSRGCPYNCSFCVSPTLWKRRVRWRSHENIVDEMEEIVRKYGVRQFHFWDDNLLLNRKHIVAVAEEILKRNLEVKWVGLSRASHLVQREEIIPLLARAGLIGMEIGIESANPDAYRIAGKNETLENLVKACEIQQRNGMFPMYTYMSFLPGDTIRGAYHQAQFMDRLLEGLPRYRYFHHLPFDVYIGQCCTPHVGTRMHDEVDRLGLPMWDEDEDFHHSATCFLPHSLLQDKPIRTTSRLTVDHRVFSVIVAYVAIADFLSYDNPWRKMANIAAFNALLDRFWAACDGSRSLLEIARTLHREHASGLDEKDTLRFLAAMSITLGQLGALDSADSREASPVTLKKVLYKNSTLYRLLLQLSRLYGKLFGCTKFRMSKHRSYDT